MGNNILLTYMHIDGYNTYSWFNDIEEANNFIEDNGHIIDELLECFDCENAIQIEIE